MEFFIRKNATLPVLKMQVVKDGRSGYLELMELLEVSTIYFSMINVQTPGAPTEYYIYYKFTARDTNTPGRYQGQFLIKNADGNLIVPIREELYVNVEDSFISETACC
jgi:hypothetical protein